LHLIEAKNIAPGTAYFPNAIEVVAGTGSACLDNTLAGLELQL